MEWETPIYLDPSAYLHLAQVNSSMSWMKRKEFVVAAGPLNSIALDFRKRLERIHKWKSY